jgi:hypothetical protein
MDSLLTSRRQVLHFAGIGTTIALAGCSSGGSGGAKATVREYINAFCSKDVETVNQLHSEYAIEDDVTESELVDADCRITNLQERNFPTTADSERLLERDSIDELKYFTLNLNIDGEMQETSISIVLENGEWKVLDIG